MLNLSLRNRVAFSFIMANLVVLLSFSVFQFLNSLNKDIEKLGDSNRISMLNFEIRISAILFLKTKRTLSKGVNEAYRKTIITETTELLRFNTYSDDILPKIQN